LSFLLGLGKGQKAGIYDYPLGFKHKLLWNLRKASGRAEEEGRHGLWTVLGLVCLVLFVLLFVLFFLA